METFRAVASGARHSPPPAGSGPLRRRFFAVGPAQAHRPPRHSLRALFDWIGRGCGARGVRRGDGRSKTCAYGGPGSSRLTDPRGQRRRRRAAGVIVTASVVTDLRSTAGGGRWRWSLAVCSCAAVQNLHHHASARRLDPASPGGCRQSGPSRPESWVARSLSRSPRCWSRGIGGRGGDSVSALTILSASGAAAPGGGFCSLQLSTVPLVASVTLGTL